MGFLLGTWGEDESWVPVDWGVGVFRVVDVDDKASLHIGLGLPMGNRWLHHQQLVRPASHQLQTNLSFVLSCKLRGHERARHVTNRYEDKITGQG
jgi:hypothetical protein